MLDFPLPVTLWDVGSNFIYLGNHENIGIAVGILPLSSLQTEIWLFTAAISGLAAAMLDFQLPVTLCEVTCSLIELGDNENMDVAVGISLLSSLQAEIWLFPVGISG
jgi:hypothetical protein